MRIGLIADIHGNLVALETVLGELARERLDRLVCLGDVAANGPRPAAVVARLRELGCPSVLGNTDAWLLDGPPPGLSHPALADLTRWAAARLSEADLAYLRACPPTIGVPFDADRRLLCFHGSPRSHDEVIAATTPDDDLAAMLASDAAAIFAGGHTHVPLLRRFGDAHVLNPGSVGLPAIGPGTPNLPRNRGVRWAEYAIVDAAEGRLRIEFRRTLLDTERMLAAARESGMPHLEWWAGLWHAGERAR